VLNALTVDVEEWFHVCGVPALGAPHWDRLESRVEVTTRLLLDLLDETNSRATFFVLGWIAERYPGLVSEIRAAGHDVGSHGHLHDRVYDVGEAAFRRDLRASVRALEASGVRPVCFRAPEWSINDRSLWALEVLASEGFTLDASMAPVKIVGSTLFPRTPHMRATAAGSVLEMPPFVADRFGQVMPLGWGWGLRMSAPATVLAAVETANRAGSPAVLTIHPWEIDPSPPRVPLPLRLRFAHYFRLGGFQQRLREVLRGNMFHSVAAVASSLPLSLP
jgi:polysaccharide deacetylase family protein (PEP-CTERM system associated)